MVDKAIFIIDNLLNTPYILWTKDTIGCGLEGLYKNVNELNSLDRKQDNYDDVNFKNVKLDDKMIIKMEELFENIYKNFNLKTILNDNYNKNFLNISDPPNKYHITAYDGDGIIRCMLLILNPSNFNMYKCYMQYQSIKKFSSMCSKELDMEFFNFYEKKINGQEKQKSIDKRSINIVNSYAGEMMGKLYVENFFSESSKNNMVYMVNNILNIMSNSLKNNDWLTNSTKIIALNKLNTFRKKIGYPDNWKDYSDLDIKMGDTLYEISKKANIWNFKIDFFDKINSVLDRNEWLMTPQTVNAYFMPTQNEIVFPAAILQPPFFYGSNDNIDFDISDELNKLPDIDFITPSNYGGIGAVIAHEITHGYDDKGRQFDGNGNLNDWWSEKDIELFKNKTEIMVNSVKKYKYVDSESNIEYNMNPELTMGENLADIGGLSLAKQALLRHLHNNKANDLEISLSLRIFFKSWANVWKQNIKKEKRIMLLNIDPHAPTDFRGNLVQHIDEFYKVFDITKNDKMFLDEKDRMKMW